MLPRYYKLWVSRPASRANVSPPRDPHLDRLMDDFKSLQSALATYRNARSARPAQATKSDRQDRAKAYTALHTPDDLPEDTLDREYALSARAQFAAEAAHSRDWLRSHADDSRSREFFDLPDDEQDY